MRITAFGCQSLSGRGQTFPVLALFGRQNSLECSDLWNTLATKDFQVSQFMSVWHMLRLIVSYIYFYQNIFDYCFHFRCNSS